MTILLDADNIKILSISSGGFVDKTLNTREFEGEIPEDNYEWDDINKKIVVRSNP